MRTILTVIFLLYIMFAFLMATPIGLMIVITELDSDKPCYCTLAFLGLAIPMTFLGAYLGFIK